MRRLLLASSVLGSGLLAVAACVGSDPAPLTTPTPDAAATATVPDTDASLPTTGDSGPSPEDAGADAGPQTFCQQQTKPDGVTELSCLDFDEAAQADAGYELQLVDDGGTFGVETDTALSPPAAFLADPAKTPIAERGGFIALPKTTGSNASLVTLRAKMRLAKDPEVVPTADGRAELMKIVVGGSTSTFGYSDGSSVNGTANYRGYFLESAFVGGAAIRLETAVTLAVPSATWTEIDFTATASDTGGAVSITMDGTPKGLLNIQLPPAADVSVFFGNHQTNTVNEPLGMFFDNVLLEVTRP